MTRMTLWQAYTRAIALAQGFEQEYGTARTPSFARELQEIEADWEERQNSTYCLCPHEQSYGHCGACGKPKAAPDSWPMHTA